MVEGLLRRIALFCAAIWLMAGGAAVAGPVFAPGSICLAADPDRAGYASLAGERGRWSCDPDDWSIATERVILRFDLGGIDTGSIDTLAMRMTRFDRMVLTLEGVDGTVASKALASDEMRLATHDWVMSAPLPELAGHKAALWAEIEKPRDTDMLTDARLGSATDFAEGFLNLEILVAGLCGVLIIPFVYNIAFFRVLRERFLLWHAIVVACLFTHIMASSGLVNRFVDLTVTQASALSVTSWTGGIVAASQFLVTVVEPGKLDPWHTRLVNILSAMMIASTAFFLFAGGPLRAMSTPVYVAMFFPVLASYALLMATALRRGSRAMRFQILAWTPIMLVGIDRATTNLGAYGSPMSIMLAQHVAIAFEVIVTSLGVADRFMAIKRQRDRAVEETRTLEQEVERDALTGLLNRRAIGSRFDRLFGAGFDTMAVIDLDHFKRINDVHGHATGDEVLRCAAAALMPNDNTLVVRMGGEEFLLLLRGSNAVLRAEHRRRAITTRVAAQVPGLEFPVTASMGLVSQPRDSRLDPDFSSLYAHCDRLLYEAKRAGRNRTMSERIMRFGHQQEQETLANPAAVA